MTFKDQTWHARVGVLGDEAETVFEQWCEENKTNFIRYGLNRPPLSVGMLPKRVRYTPDYLTSHCFYEVQGCGADQTIKLKIEKLNSLKWWNDLMEVKLFFWNNKTQTHCIVTLDQIDELLNSLSVVLDSFAEGKAYFAFKWADLNGS